MANQWKIVKRVKVHEAETAGGLEKRINKLIKEIEANDQTVIDVQMACTRSRLCGMITYTGKSGQRLL